MVSSLAFLQTVFSFSHAVVPAVSLMLAGGIVVFVKVYLNFHFNTSCLCRLCLCCPVPVVTLMMRSMGLDSAQECSSTYKTVMIRIKSFSITKFLQATKLILSIIWFLLDKLLPCCSVSLRRFQCTNALISVRTHGELTLGQIDYLWSWSPTKVWIKDSCLGTTTDRRAWNWVRHAKNHCQKQQEVETNCWLLGGIKYTQAEADYCCLGSLKNMFRRNWIEREFNMRGGKDPQRRVKRYEWPPSSNHVASKAKKLDNNNGSRKKNSWLSTGIPGIAVGFMDSVRGANGRCWAEWNFQLVKSAGGEKHAQHNLEVCLRSGVIAS